MNPNQEDVNCSLYESSLPEDHIFAPVLIPTLNRYEHFVRCVESLSLSPLAKYTTLYVGLDYPASEKHWDGYLKISDYLDRQTLDFKEIVIEKRDSNYGNVKNFLALCNLVKRKYRYYICTEDDNEFSPAFLEFMNRGLYEFDGLTQVLSISGYSYPAEWRPGSSGVMYVDSYFPSWGYASWFERMDLARSTICEDYVKELVLSKAKVQHVRKTSLASFKHLAAAAVSDRISATDCTIDFYLLDKGMFVLVPRVSLVRNHG